MSNPKVLVRHAEATNFPGSKYLLGQDRRERFAYLTKSGKHVARAVGGHLLEMGIDASSSRAAASEYRPLAQTALYAGFDRCNISLYDTLNKPKLDIDDLTKTRMSANNESHPLQIAAAERLLADPPEEPVWIMHGVMVKAIKHAIGMSPEHVLIPPMGSINVLDLDAARVEPILFAA
jgi:hypothetical protein